MFKTIIRGILITILANIATIIAAPNFHDFDDSAKAGENLTIAFLGGSLTWGARSSDPQKTSYRALICQKLKEIYPQAHFTFIDAAIGGTGAQLGAYRLNRDVLAYKPDLVFLDFTLNDGVYKTTPDTLAAHEAIIRRIISEAGCPVIQMFLAAQKMVTDGTTEKMERYKAHKTIADAYNVPCGDAIVLMQKKFKDGKLNLAEVWPPETFDTCHPCDKGYALYAEAAWDAFCKAVNDKITCTVPEKMVNGNTYMNVLRKKLSSIKPLPEGWRVTRPPTNYCAFDFLMTRWLDDMSVASNFIPKSRTETTPSTSAKPLKLKFNGSSVMLFGVSTPHSGKIKVNIDGEEKEYNTCQLGDKNVGRMWISIAEGLDKDKEHTLTITPVLADPEKPQEVCIESICIAGGKPYIKINVGSK